MTEFHTSHARHLHPIPAEPPPPTPDQPNPCPTRLRDPDAAARTADLAVPCPHCGATPGTHCVIPGTTRPPAGGTHPTRHDAATRPHEGEPTP